MIPFMRRRAARVVEPLGHEVIEAADGQEAQRLLRAEPFDLVILDWLLPGMSGFEVLYWIRRTLGASPAVLFATSKTLEDEIVLAMDAGANDYIAKPFRVAELASRVNALLMRSARYRPLRRDRSRRLPARSARAHDHAARCADQADAEGIRSRRTVLQQRRQAAVAQAGLHEHVGARARSGVAHARYAHLPAAAEARALPGNGVRLSVVYTHGYRLEAVSS